MCLCFFYYLIRFSRLSTYTDWLTLHLQKPALSVVGFCWIIVCYYCLLLDFKYWETFSNCHFHTASLNTNKVNTDSTQPHNWCEFVYWGSLNSSCNIQHMHKQKKNKKKSFSSSIVFLLPSILIQYY